MVQPVKTKKKCSGSALIELVVTSSLVLTVLMGGTTVLYLSMARLWLDHVLYEGVICLSRGEYECRRQVLRQVNQVLVFGRIKSLELRTRGLTWEGELTWSLKDQWTLKCHKKLSQSDFF